MEVLTCFINWYPACLNIYWNKKDEEYESLVKRQTLDDVFESRLGVVKMRLTNDSRLDLDDDEVRKLIGKIPRIIEGKIMENLELTTYRLKKLSEINIIARMHSMSSTIEFDIHFEDSDLFKNVEIKYSDRLEIL